MATHPGAVLAALIAATGCGSAEVAEPVEPMVVAEPVDPEPADRSVPRVPIEIDIATARVGESLRLDVKGVARGHGEGEDIEDPTLWTVTASYGDVELDRVVNGPVRVARNPVGDPAGDQWDVIVQFSVSFSCPEEADEVQVSVRAPGRPAMTTAVHSPPK